MSGWLGLNGTNTKAVTKYTGLSLQTSALDKPIQILWGRARVSPNIIWNNDFKSHKHKQGGKGAGGGGKGATSYTYTVALILALCEGAVQSVPTVYTNGSPTSLAALGLTLFTGTISQTPPSYITTNHPTEALSYSQTAYLFASSYDLGSQPNLPQNSFEVIGNLSGTMPGTDDVNLADCLSDLIGNTQYGMGMDAADLDATSLAYWKSYMQAQGLFFSPLLESQENATDIIDRWALLSNSWIFWSGDVIKFVPLGDEALSANSATYTPNTTIICSLTIDHFLDKEQPITVDRIDPADAYNRVALEISDRALQYNSNPIEYKDQTLIDLYGLRNNSSIGASEIRDAAIGQIAATLVGQRMAYVRNTYTFKLPYRFVFLEPGDLVEITDPNIESITNLPVRIKTVSEDENGALDFTAEEYTGSVGIFQSVSQSTPSPTNFDRNSDPGNTNPPAVFEPNSALTNGTPQVWISASGGANWAGAEVYISFDGTTYSFAGTITSPAKQGVLTAGLASHADPDTVDTLSVDLTQSQGVLDPVTNADADALRSLSLVNAQPVLDVIQTTGQELLAYGNVASTGTYTDDLTYLRRGKYGTSPSAHSIGDMFTLVDLTGASGSTLIYDLPAQYVGSTIYLKFLSYNIYGLALQDLASVTAYQYTPIGAGFGGGAGGVPTTPTGLVVTGSTAKVSMAWNANPSTDNVQAYKVYRAPGPGGVFGSATLIATTSSLEYIDSSVSPSTTYTYFLVASNAAGDSVNTSGDDATTSTGGASIIIEDEGTTLTSSPHSMNFTGAGVTATDDGSGNVTVDVPGGGGSGSGVPDPVRILQDWPIAIPQGGAGGGTSGGGAFSGATLLGGATQETNAHATKGNFFTVQQNCHVTAIWVMAIQNTTAKTFQGNISQLTGQTVSSTVSSIQGTTSSASTISGGTAARPVRLAFASPVALTAGQTYLFSVTRTDSTTTSSMDIYRVGTGANGFAPSGPLLASPNNTNVPVSLNSNVLTVGDAIVAVAAVTDMFEIWAEGTID